MIIYRETKGGFINDVLNGKIADNINKAFVAHLGRHTSPNEIASWRNSMMYMHAKVVKDIRNTVNRKVNFEQANLARSVAAATRQYEAIAKIKEKIGFDALPPELREIARLRYNNREESNSEIAAMLSKPLTVSGVNHRFQKLIKIAGELKQ